MQIVDLGALSILDKSQQLLTLLMVMQVRPIWLLCDWSCSLRRLKRRVPLSRPKTKPYLQHWLYRIRNHLASSSALIVVVFPASRTPVSCLP